MTVTASRPDLSLGDWDLDSTIAQRFRYVASLVPERPAIETDERTMTYAELDALSDRWAAVLQGRNPNGVGIIVRDPLRAIVTIFAVSKAGTHYVPLDADYPAERLQLILDDGPCQLIVYDEETRSIVDSLVTAGIELLSIDDLQSAPAAPLSDQRTIHNAILYTSGSTGKPKGVIHSDQAVLRKSHACHALFGGSPGERCSSFGSPAFARAANEIFTNLLSGNTLLPKPVNETGLLPLARWIAEKRVNVIRFSPSLFRNLMAAAGDSVRFPDVRFVGLGSEAITRNDVAMFHHAFEPHAELQLHYASTEGAVIAAHRIRQGDPLPETIPLGRPYPGVEISLVDDDGALVPDGQEGEVVVRSPYIASGFWNRADDSSRFGSDALGALVRTGDRAFVRDGLFYFAGRSDQQLKIRGVRVEPRDIENVVLRDERIRETCVVAHVDGESTRLVCYWVASPDVEIQSGELRKRVAEAMPAAMVPSAFRRLEKLPVNPNGKIDRKALSIMPAPRPSSHPRTRSGDATLDALCDIAESVFDLECVNLDDNLFDDLGADSLSAARYLAAIEQRLGPQVPLAALVDANTPRLIARELDALRTHETLVRLRDGGSKQPLFFVAGGGGNILGFQRVAKALAPDRPIYALQAYGLNGRFDGPTTFEDMARANIAQMFALQPRGPFHIIGYSIGGRLAYEMAIQLERAGIERGLVGLIDIGPEETDTSLGTRLMARIQMVKADPVNRPLHMLRELKLRTRHRILGMIRGRIGKRRDLPTVLKTASVVYSAAFRKYVVGPYAGKIALFRSSEGLGRLIAERDYGWSRYVAGGVDVIEINGEHDRILISPNSESLAVVIDRVLISEESRKGQSPDAQVSAEAMERV